MHPSHKLIEIPQLGTGTQDAFWNVIQFVFNCTAPLIYESVFEGDHSLRMPYIKWYIKNVYEYYYYHHFLSCLGLKHSKFKELSWAHNSHKSISKSTLRAAINWSRSDIGANQVVNETHIIYNKWLISSGFHIFIITNSTCDTHVNYNIIMRCDKETG